MLKAAGQEQLQPLFTIEPVANLDKIELIREEEVKCIALNSTAYEASMEYNERRTVKKTLLKSVTDALKTVFEEDPDEDLRTLGQHENLMVKLEISFDSRKKGGEIGQKRMQAAASTMVNDDDEDGFSIVTRQGSKLSADEVRISKKVVLDAYGNSISKDSARDALEEYMRELHETGVVHQ